MFKRIGTFSVRNKLWIILAWAVAAAAMLIFAPQLKDVARLGESASLPAGAQSVKANDLLEKNFPGAQVHGSATLLLHNPSALSSADTTYASSLRDWLLTQKGRLGITGVQSVFDDPTLSAFLISPDKTVMLMPVTFVNQAADAPTVKAVESIRSDMPEAPSDGLEVHVSGEAGLNADLMDAVNKGIETTTRVTIILVIALLLIIYRSPMAALVPLITITGAYLVARGLLAYVAQAGLSVWSQVDAYLVVIVFGVGTDYCLFIMSRLREEMNRDDKVDARVSAIGKIGIVITASAATVVVAFLGLLVGRLEVFRTLGPFLALAVVITLIAALTLTPALASIFGRNLFWPARGQGGTSRVGVFGWSGIARLVTTRPALAAGVVVVLLLIPYLSFSFYARSYDILSQLPSGMDAVAGFRELQAHYDIGELNPLTAVVIAPQEKTLSDPQSLASLAKVTQAISQVKGVRTVRSPAQADGTGQWMLVSGQLQTLSGTVSATEQAVGAPLQQSTQQQTLGVLSTTVKAYLDELGAAYPQAKTYQAYSGSLTALSQTNTVLMASPPDLRQIKSSFGDLSMNLSSLANDFKSVSDAYLLPRSLMAVNPDLQRLAEAFWSPDFCAVKFSIVLTDYPYGAEAFDAARRVASTLRSFLASSPGSISLAQSGVAGAAAKFADVQQVTDSDFFRVFSVVLAGVLVVLALLLRSLLAPLYLLLTVLLSYGTTLGISAIVFQKLLGQAGISYIVPTFLMVILIALGEDYNIFLMSRVREECQGTSTKDGVRVAATATGGIITACGLILAGTFASLASTGIQPLVQTGGAIAIGLLIDTFVVRAFLVPAIAATMGKWNWWPSKPGV